MGSLLKTRFSQTRPKPIFNPSKTHIYPYRKYGFSYVATEYVFKCNRNVPYIIPNGLVFPKLYRVPEACSVPEVILAKLLRQPPGYVASGASPPELYERSCNTCRRCLWTEKVFLDRLRASSSAAASTWPEHAALCKSHFGVRHSVPYS